MGRGDGRTGRAAGAPRGRALVAEERDIDGADRRLALGRHDAVDALESFLYDLPTMDPVTYIGVTLVVAAIGVAAGYVPALRASRVDPMKVLKTE